MKKLYLGILTALALCALPAVALANPYNRGCQGGALIGTNITQGIHVGMSYGTAASISRRGALHEREVVLPVSYDAHSDDDRSAASAVDTASVSQTIVERTVLLAVGRRGAARERVSNVERAPDTGADCEPNDRKT